MTTVFCKELRSGFKSFLIWTLSVGGFGLFCILLFKSMESSIADMAVAFSEMGSFADAFGMSTISIATLTGFFASEGGTIHALGSGMFSAIIASAIISKEEAGHSVEFLLALPLSRRKVLTSKIFAVLSELIAFTAICGGFYSLGFVIMDEKIPAEEFILFLIFSLFMNIVIAMICILLSALSSENRTGVGLGIALLFYVFDLITRAVPKLEDFAFLSPFSFANAPEIFSGESASASSVIMGISVIVICLVGCYTLYERRDLKS